MVFNLNDELQAVDSDRSIEVLVGRDGSTDNVNAALLETSQRHQLGVGVFSLSSFDLLGGEYEFL